MRIATWNVNGLRARLELVLHWLDEVKPTIAGFQELKLADDQFPEEAFAEVGYQALWYGQKAWNGVAVLSREPLELVERGLPGQQDFGSRLITAHVAGLRFTTIYVPNGKGVSHADFPRKLAWLDSLAGHLQTGPRPDAGEVVCGDLNIAPAALDSWNEAELAGSLFHTADERSRFQQLLDLDLYDCYRRLNPRGTDLSWWDYRGGAFRRGHGLRIDFLLVSGSVMERVTAVEVQRQWRKKQHGLTASDHAPVIADIADPA